jgi:hypothetical protein
MLCRDMFTVDSSLAVTRSGPNRIAVIAHENPISADAKHDARPVTKHRRAATHGTADVPTAVAAGVDADLIARGCCLLYPASPCLDARTFKASVVCIQSVLGSPTSLDGGQHLGGANAALLQAVRQYFLRETENEHAKASTL